MLLYAALLAVFAAVLWVGGRLLSAYLRNRGPRVVTCPETRLPTAVAVDARKTALTGALRAPEFRLESCSRWPERRNCGQECLAEIVSAPDGCLLRNILANWYASRSCVFCGTPIGELEGAVNKPALLSPTQVLVTWEQIVPDKVHETLHTHLPVCWNCGNTYSFMREHPGLITDRSRTY